MWTFGWTFRYRFLFLLSFTTPLSCVWWLFFVLLICFICFHLLVILASIPSLSSPAPSPFAFRLRRIISCFQRIRLFFIWLFFMTFLPFFLISFVINHWRTFMIVSAPWSTRFVISPLIVSPWWWLSRWLLIITLAVIMLLSIIGSTPGTGSPTVGWPRQPSRILLFPLNHWLWCTITIIMFALIIKCRRFRGFVKLWSRGWYPFFVESGGCVNFMLLLLHQTLGFLFDDRFFQAFEYQSRAVMIQRLFLENLI